ncbi:MAG: FAD-dependent oxidoreductase [Thermodesulfobacteriota bacterium]|jgi:alkyl hydroperoxide reductase subunit F
MAQDLYDTVVIGGGPAGAAAAVYAARKRLKTLVVTEAFGGQSMVSSSIQNWIGEVALSGLDLAEKLRRHVEAQKGIEIKIPERVVAVTQGADCIFEVKTDGGTTYRSKTVIVCSGGRHRRLGIPGEEKFEGRGLAFCSTCDAPFYNGLGVAVVGSGNAALEAVVDLIPYAHKIYLLIRSGELKGDPVTEEKAKGSARLQIISNAEVVEILGDQTVNRLRYKDKRTGEVKELAVSGVFVQIGLSANSDFIRSLIDTNQAGEIIVEHRTAQTSKKGIFAAGDVTDDPFKQNNISAGDGVRTSLSAYQFVLNIQKYSPCADKEE